MIGRCGSIEQETEGEDTLERTASEAASIQRRLRFAGCSQIYLKTALHRMGLGGFGSRLGRIPHNVTNVLYDLAEGAWNGFQWKNPGQVHIAALEAPIRLAQTPRHQGYWYDAQRHALVGMHLGLDLVRNRGRYHLIEANLSAALRPER
jgi:hypothetical protein